MRALANYRFLRAFIILTWIGTFPAALTGCATSRSSQGVGFSVISPTPDALPESVDVTGKPTTESSDSSGSVGTIFKGFGSFGPGALLVVPFALAYEALLSTTQSESNKCDYPNALSLDRPGEYGISPAGLSRYGCGMSQCEAVLNSTYPSAAAMFRNAVQREFEPKDILEGFMASEASVRTRSRGGEVVVVASPTEARGVPTTQQLLDIASQRGLARLFVIEVLGMELMPTDAGCEQWAFRVDLRVSNWDVAYGTRMGQPVLTYPYANAQLSALQTIMEEPGAIRAQLAWKFRDAADDLFQQRRFSR